MSENNELSIIQKADLVSLIKQGGQIMDVPFSHDIFLDSFLVAGTYYVDEIENMRNPSSRAWSFPLCGSRRTRPMSSPSW